MRLFNEEPTDELADTAAPAEILVHDSHDVLERMETSLTLAEAKLAITQRLIAKRHRHE
jgi:ABC-type antimicrobial peptide transport system ATPase subunit